ncbi:hypothetical protein PBI_LUCKY3_13 [Microbacterium phage Lucky3]|uniref:Uncharacterized protein n=2 Tax=Kojivirus golden TaxID=2560590 RepID=A0A2P1CFS2_9CAUD|nr:hypothetical protein FDJ42_gp13 [Microbacterium phage Golden]AVJ49761.1 hypothetical protein PBI_GOLDEN_13 [Microbacterium phage Golden]AVJ50070.1 hypothetical protein PBI_LUCKY3_13 [Microbacterium phage Lucky3]WNM67986.1 hypothetical protein SEA_SIRVICTOR_13 [Microbacterium phage SirVictor]WNM74357.1 hypothetical protein SEA_GUETZIE_13 [Microbacterium phage Guetzie]
MTRGIVVDHKETGVRYAVSERNFNEKVHKKVRDLKPGESVIGYQPRRKKPVGQQPAPSHTEGSSAEGTKEAKKEGN